jgi:hypothetical protein
MCVEQERAKGVEKAWARQEQTHTKKTPNKTPFPPSKLTGKRLKTRIYD